MEFGDVPRLSIIYLVTYKDAGRARITVDGVPMKGLPGGCGFIDAYDKSTRYSQESPKVWWFSNEKGRRRQVYNAAFRKMCQIPGLTQGRHNITVTFDPLNDKEMKIRGGG